MCLAIPGKVIAVVPNADGLRMGRVDFGGVVKDVCLDYVPEVDPGHYVLVHVGFALSRVDEEEALRTYRLLAEIGALAELSGEGAAPSACPAFPPP